MCGRGYMSLGAYKYSLPRFLRIKPNQPTTQSRDLDTLVEQKCLNYLGMWMREADQASLWDNNELTHRAHRRPIHSEWAPTTKWRAHRDDLTNSSQQAQGVSCKLMQSSQQAHSVSHLVSSMWANWVSSKWAHREMIQVSSLWVWCWLAPSMG